MTNRQPKQTGAPFLNAVIGPILALVALISCFIMRRNGWLSLRLMSYSYSIGLIFSLMAETSAGRESDHSRIPETLAAVGGIGISLIFMLEFYLSHGQDWRFVKDGLFLAVPSIALMVPCRMFMYLALTPLGMAIIRSGGPLVYKYPSFVSVSSSLYILSLYYTLRAIGVLSDFNSRSLSIAMWAIASVAFCS